MSSNFNRSIAIFFTSAKLPLFVWGVSLWLLVLPFVFWSPGPIPFEIPRVVYVRYTSWLFIIGALLARRSEAVTLWRHWLVLAWLAWIIASSLMGVDLYKSWHGNYFRLDGLSTYLPLIVTSFVVGAQIKPKHGLVLSLAIWTGSIGVAGLALREAWAGQFLGFSSGGWSDGAVGASFGQPNFLAGYLAVTLAFGLYLFDQTQSRSRRLVLQASGVIVGWGLWVTQSSGGMLAAFVALGLWLLFKPLSGWLKVAITCLGLMVVTGGFWQYWQWYVVDVHPDNRIRIVRQLVQAVSYRPLTGWGWANVDYAFASNSWPIEFEHDIYVDKAHSSFLEVLVTTGGIGLALYLILISRVGLRLGLVARKDSWYQSLLIVFLVYFVHSQTNVTSIGEEVIFWLVVGIGYAQFKNSNSGIE